MKVSMFISDIHGNYNALQKMLEIADNENIKNIFCLGDMIGYGPEPEKVVQEIIRRKIPCVCGNHERALFDQEIWDWSSEVAQKSFSITEDLLSDESMDFISNLPETYTFENKLLVHGSPPDSYLDYIHHKTATEIKGALVSFWEDYAFVGHTHEILAYEYGRKYREIDYNEISSGLRTKSGSRYIFSCGSVGQPRDAANKRAKALLVKETKGSEVLDVSVIETDYDVAATVKLINKLGFPSLCGDRLR